MKKFLAILLISVMVMSLTVNFSFADEISEEEKAEIIDAAKTAYKVYDAMKGFYHYYDEEWVDFSGKMFFEIISVDRTKEIDWGYYRKTNFKANSSDEVFELIDRYYEGYAKEKMWVFVDTERQGFEINEEKTDILYFTDEISLLPLVLVIDGEIYTYTHLGLAYTEGACPEFDTAVVTYADKKSAVVTMNVVWDDSLGQNVDEVTITMTKTSEGWKINGGTLFTHHFLGGFIYPTWYPEKAPSTGENTVLYIAIAGAAVVCMTALLVRKKREVL